MKNLKITNKFPKKSMKLVLAGIGMVAFFTGCGSSKVVDNENIIETENVTKEETIDSNKQKVKEGILVIGDEEFLIEYIKYDYYVNGEIKIKFVDGSSVSTTHDNFYEYDKTSETMNKIKQLIIEEDHIIK